MTKALAFLALLPVATLGAQAPWKTDDTQRFQHVGDVRIAPDGRLVAYQVNRTDLAANRHTSSIAVVPAAGGAPRVLTPAGWSDESPRWSPDGRRLAFLATHGDTTALWTADPDGGHRRRVVAVLTSNHRYADLEDGDPFSWSPDGRSFVVVAADPHATAVARDPLVITRYMYQAYTDYDDGLIDALWIVPADGGAPRRLSDGQHVDGAPSWSPDGKSIVFVSNRESDPDMHRNDDLWIVYVASGQLRRLTNTAGSEVRPVWSPDGKWITYLATTRPWASYDSMAEDFHVWVIPAAGGSPRELNGALDRRSLSALWSPDSRAVVFTAESEGRVLPYRVAVDGGASTPVFSADVSVSEPTIAADGHLAFAIQSTMKPAEAAVLDAGASAPRILSHVNDAVLASLPVRDAQTLWFTTTENTRVQGWLLTPRPFIGDTGGLRSLPLLLSIHGGPHGAFGFRFNPEYQMYASRGYAVLYINPRGSTAYGQRFSDACIGNWGGVDYTDLMMGVDYVLATERRIDPDRMFVTGGSYGGFMTNWIVTHTGRFRAAATREGMSNLMTDQALSDAPDLEMIEFGPPAQHAEDYLRWSPIRYIANAVTPTLIIHGERDHDVTMAEAGQMYGALRLQGVESRLVIYPREPHGFREPKHIVDAYDRMWAWFDAHRAGTQVMDQRWDSDRAVQQWSQSLR